jgi:hypothetical protein
MEMAAIFCYAESEREKGDQLILKKPVEKLIFIAETCYPIWLAPWRKRTLAFDGFGITDHTFSHDVVPDTKSFESDIQASADTREAYVATLSNNLNYFRNFSGKDEKTIEGLTTNPEFINDLASYTREAKEVGKPVMGKAFLSPIINPSAISVALEEILSVGKSQQDDIKNLRSAMKLLRTTTREHVRTIREEIRATGREFDEKITEVKPEVMYKLQEIQRKGDQEITRLSKDYERRLRTLHEDRIRLEREQHRLDTQIERSESEIRSSKLRKDEGGELQWKRRLQETKKKLPGIKKNIQEIDDKIEKTEATKRMEISKIRGRYETKADEAKNVLRELEASREAGVRMKEQERESLEEMTSGIIDQMNEMVKNKRAALEGLDALGMRQHYEHNVLAHMPVYLIAYEAKQKRRFMVYPPSVVRSMGIGTKFKGVFGMTRMKSFLQHRSRHLTSVLSQLVTLLKEDPVFEKEASDAGIHANIIGTEKSQEYIKKGLGELRQEGWISEKEYTAFKQALTRE